MRMAISMSVTHRITARLLVPAAAGDPLTPVERALPYRRMALARAGARVDVIPRAETRIPPATR